VRGDYEMIEHIIKKLLKFRNDRNWQQFHTPENLAKSISIEAGELLEIFQWSDSPKDKNIMRKERGDILIYLAYLCDYYGSTFEEDMQYAMEINEQNYPVEKFKGKATREKVEFKTERLA
jgi:dCTP diphosphatase